MTLDLRRLDHPADILACAADWRRRGVRFALVVVTGSRGGAVRADGALMLVGEAEHVVAGYVSNGCIDADVALQARAALSDGRPRRLSYGEGSPFIDIRLPCGGAIDLLVAPDPDPSALSQAADGLAGRQALGLRFAPDGSVHLMEEPPLATGWLGETLRARFAPKPRLRVAGRGAEPLALLRLARAAGFEILVQSPDEDLLSAADALGAVDAQHLKTPKAFVAASDDPWTAFVLMFHDHEWETGLLAQALRGSAFYVGALGSRKTHQIRCDALRGAGVAEADIERIHAPIGSIPSLRDASLIAVSTLAEIVAVQTAKAPACV